MRSSETRRGGEVLAALLIGAGALLLALRVFDWQIADDLWPSFIIVPGIGLLAAGMLAPKGQSRFLAVAGAVVTGTGVILLAQTLTNYFESWAYAWALLPLFAGLALVSVGRREADAALTATGRSLVMSGAVMFAVFGVIFEGLIFKRFLPIGDGYVLPVALIAIGTIVLLRYRLPARSRDRTTSEGERAQAETRP